MPELPEVEAMCQYLDRAGLSNYVVKGVTVHRGKYLKDGVADLIGKRFSLVRRRGKYMLFMMYDGGLLLGHNAMSGFWDLASRPWTFDYVEGKRKSTESDVRVSIHLESVNGTLQDTLRFHDARLFGSLRYFPQVNNITQFERAAGIKLGPEPLWTPCGLSFDWMLHEFKQRCRNSSTKTIKEVLMDQSVVAGVGNIYAAEALYRASMRPDRPAHLLTDPDIFEVWFSTKKVLEFARNWNFNINYTGLNVYRVKKCGTCGSDIQNVKIAGRSSYFCDTCQD